MKVGNNHTSPQVQNHNIKIVGWTIVLGIILGMGALFETHVVGVRSLFAARSIVILSANVCMAHIIQTLFEKYGHKDTAALVYFFALSLLFAQFAVFTHFHSNSSWPTFGLTLGGAGAFMTALAVSWAREKKQVFEYDLLRKKLLVSKDPKEIEKLFSERPEEVIQLAIENDILFVFETLDATQERLELAIRYQRIDIAILLMLKGAPPLMNWNYTKLQFKPTHENWFFARSICDFMEEREQRRIEHTTQKQIKMGLILDEEISSKPILFTLLHLRSMAFMLGNKFMTEQLTVYCKEALKKYPQANLPKDANGLTLRERALFTEDDELTALLPGPDTSKPVVRLQQPPKKQGIVLLKRAISKKNYPAIIDLLKNKQLPPTDEVLKLLAELLPEACYKNQKELVQLLLAELKDYKVFAFNDDENSPPEIAAFRDPYGVSPLYNAYLNDNKLLMNYLLQIPTRAHKKDIEAMLKHGIKLGRDHKLITSFINAAIRCDVDISFYHELFLEHLEFYDFESGVNILPFLIKYNLQAPLSHSEILEIYIKKKQPVSIEELFKLAKFYNRPEIAIDLLKNKNFVTTHEIRKTLSELLPHAFYKNQKALVDLLIVELDGHIFDPRLWLLVNHYKFNLPPPSGIENHHDMYGFSPLYNAFNENNRTLVNYLMQRPPAVPKKEIDELLLRTPPNLGENVVLMSAFLDAIVRGDVVLSNESNRERELYLEILEHYRKKNQPLAKP